MEEQQLTEFIEEQQTATAAEIFSLCERWEGGKDLFTYLTNSDFFTAPASVRYYGAYEGGLVKHTLDTIYYIQEINKIFKANYSQDTLIKVALCHEVSKADFYEVSTKNEKVEGQWISKPIYKVKDISNRYTAGDLGLTSYMIASRYLSFTDEEITAICNYSKLSNVEKFLEISSLGKKVPLIVLLYIADLMATYGMEN
jgi:hypothetical protein